MTAMFQTPAPLTDRSLTAPLFKIPLARQTKRLVEPYKAFAPNFHMGFGDEAARIAVQQNRKSDVFASPPDHPFVLDLTFEDVGATRWISLEARIDTAALTPTGRLSVLGSVKATQKDPIGVTLRVFRADGSFADLGLGRLQPGLGTSYGADTVSQRLSPLAETLDRGTESAFVLLFFPVAQGQSFSLAMLNLFVTEEPLS